MSSSARRQDAKTARRTAAKAAAATVVVAALLVGTSACGSGSDSSKRASTTGSASTVNEKLAGGPDAGPPVPTDGTTTFFDTFDGRAGDPPDRNEWVPYLGPGKNAELQYYTDNKNAQLDGQGNLVLTARKEDVPGTKCPRSFHDQHIETCHYTSARLSTKSKFSQQRGRFEAAVETPIGNDEANGGGVWPAWWLLGRNNRDHTQGAPAQGEIDIDENIGQRSNTFGYLHGPTWGMFGWELTKTGKLPGVDLNAFQKFAVDVEPDRITWYINDTEIASVTPQALKAAGKGDKWVADQPFYGILNLALGGGWAKDPKAGLLPKQMKIAWVRMSCPNGIDKVDGNPMNEAGKEAWTDGDESIWDTKRIMCKTSPATGTTEPTGNSPPPSGSGAPPSASSSGQ
jgi:beta-glucanase (GH16 family)